MILAEGKCTKNPKEQTYPSDATKTKQGAAHRTTPCFLWTLPFSCCSAANKRCETTTQQKPYFTSSKGTSVTVPLLPAP